MSDRLLGGRRWRGGRARGRFGGRGRRLLRRRFRCCGCCLSDRHRNPEQAPLSIHGREREFEIELLGDRGKQACHMHEAVGLDLRQQAQLRIDRGDAREIEIVVTLLGENLRKPRGAAADRLGGGQFRRRRRNSAAWHRRPRWTDIGVVGLL